MSKRNHFRGPKVQSYVSTVNGVTSKMSLGISTISPDISGKILVMSRKILNNSRIILESSKMFLKLVHNFVQLFVGLFCGCIGLHKFEDANYQMTHPEAQKKTTATTTT